MKQLTVLSSDESDSEAEYYCKVGRQRPRGSKGGRPRLQISPEDRELRLKLQRQKARKKYKAANPAKIQQEARRRLIR